MAIDFTKFAYQPRPLQQWDIGEGLNDIIQGNRAREAAGRQESQYARTRDDSQSQFSANFAKAQGDDQNQAATTRHQKKAALVNAATMAAQNGDWNTARALAPRILELGGEASESGTPDNPIFRFKAGAEPARAPLDFGGARRQIFGGGNPMDPPALPGASAAAMGPQQTQGGPQAAGSPPLPPPMPQTAVDTAGPPPGPAIDGAPAPPAPSEPSPGVPSEISTGTQSSTPPNDSGAPAAPQAAQPASPQLTGPNPFDPYTINTAEVTASNRLRLDPMLQGINEATPSRFRPQVTEFTRKLGDLRLNPSATLEAAKPYFSELSGLYRGEVAADGQAGRLEAMNAQRESTQENKDRADARAFTNKIIENESLKKIKEQVRYSKAANDLLKQAGSNPNVANALIESLYKMRNTGVMTDKDFDRSSKGAQSLWSALKNDTLNTFFQVNGGFNPDMIRDIKELLDLGTRSSRSAMMEARDGLYRAWQRPQTNMHRQVYEEAIRSFFPPDFLPEEFKQSWEQGDGGAQVPVYDIDEEEAEMQRMAAEEGGLGVVDVPARSHPSPGGMPPEPNRAGAVRGSRVLPKPARRRSNKPVKDMTPEELKEEMNKILE